MHINILYCLQWKYLKLKFRESSLSITLMPIKYYEHYQHELNAYTTKN